MECVTQGRFTANILAMNVSRAVREVLNEQGFSWKPSTPPREHNIVGPFVRANIALGLPRVLGSGVKDRQAPSTKCDKFSPAVVQVRRPNVHT